MPQNKQTKKKKKTHGKQHDGRKGMRINPLTAKPNA